MNEGSPLSATLYLMATIDPNEYTKYSYHNGFMDDFVLTSANEDLKIALEKVLELAKKKISEKVKMSELSKQMKIPILKNIYYRQVFLEAVKMGEKREMIFSRASQKTMAFSQEKFRNYGKRRVVKKSTITKMLPIWNGNVKEIKGMSLMQIKRYAKKKFM